MTQPNIKRILVTGGGGFLGRNICQILRTRGYEVHSLGRNFYPYLEPLGVVQFQGDIGKGDGLKAALEGCDAVIHTAAKAGVWGRKEDFYLSNVVGTQNVLDAMKEQKIRYLVYASSPSVVYAGIDILGSDESLPYPSSHRSYYAWSKRLAEEMVLCCDGVIKVALRPHLIWGPDDPHFLPRMLAKAKAKRLARVGNQNNQVDVIFVENAALAHVQALEALLVKPELNGNAYFLGQEKPVKLWDFVDQLLIHNGEKALQRKVGFGPAYILASFMEGAYRLLGIYEKEPPLTRFLVQQLATSHFFSHKKAWNDFGYKPVVSIEEGLRKFL